MFSTLHGAWRALRRRPGFSMLSVGLLGLGVAAVTATWTVLHQAVLQPLPVDDPDALVIGWIDHVARGADHFPVTAPLFDELERGAVPALAGVAAVPSFGASRGLVEGADGLSTVSWTRVLGDFFGVLGAAAHLGRTLEIEDDVPGPSAPAVVISHGLWMRRYGGSPDVLGTEVRTKQGSYSIVGVMPRAFDYPRGTEVWAPTRPAYPDWDSERPFLELDLVARLAPGATIAEATRQLSAAGVSTPDLASVYDGSQAVVRPFTRVLQGDMRSTLIVLFLGALLVLLVSGFDLMNMALARAVEERSTLVVRRALGAEPRRLLASAWSEAIILAAGSVLMGVGLAWMGVRVFLPLAPPDLLRLDAITGLHAGAVGLAVVLGFGVMTTALVIPRWMEVARLRASTLRPSPRTTSAAGTYLRDALAVGQVGLAVWVVVSGALLVRTALNLQSLEPGFEPAGLSAVALDYAQGGVLAEPGSADRLRAAAAALTRYPGISGATPVQMPPLPGPGAWQTILRKEGQDMETAIRENVYVFMEFVEPVYFDFLGIPVLRGRLLAGSDRRDAPPVVVVNEAMAQLYWAGEESIGALVRTGLPGIEDTPFTVVGIAGDTRYGALREAKPTVYFALPQVEAFRSQQLLVRSDDSAPPLLQAVRAALAEAAPGVRAVSVERVEDRLAAPLAGPRFSALLSSTLALTALVIALVGVYAVLAFIVRIRRREIGIRLACGGSPLSIGAYVMRRGLAVALLGAVVGAIAATWSGRAFETLLFGVSATDVTTVLVGVGLTMLAACLVCLGPARRAARVDPVEALLAE